MKIDRVGNPEVVLREVIEVKFRRGVGVPRDPIRIVIGYYSLEGELLAEDDPYAPVSQSVEETDSKPV